jgi:hypothetical protein
MANRPNLLVALVFVSPAIRLMESWSDEMPNHPRPPENVSKCSNNAEKALEGRLRGLAKNMRAIGEGGGKPDELVDEIVKVAESLIAYNEAYGIRPHQELIRRALANPEFTNG